MEENYKHPEDAGYFPGAEKIKMPLEFLTKNSPHSDGQEYRWNTMEELRRAQHPIKFRNSCTLPCSPSDWYKGGKCDKNGCYHE